MCSLLSLQPSVVGVRRTLVLTSVSCRDLSWSLAWLSSRAWRSLRQLPHASIKLACPGVSIFPTACRTTHFWPRLKSDHETYERSETWWRPHVRWYKKRFPIMDSMNDDVLYFTKIILNEYPEESKKQLCINLDQYHIGQKLNHRLLSKHQKDPKNKAKYMIWYVLWWNRIMFSIFWKNPRRLIFQ